MDELQYQQVWLRQTTFTGNWHTSPWLLFTHPCNHRTYSKLLSDKINIYTTSFWIHENHINLCLQNISFQTFAVIITSTVHSKAFCVDFCLFSHKSISEVRYWCPVKSCRVLVQDTLVANHVFMNTGALSCWNMSEPLPLKGYLNSTAYSHSREFCASDLVARVWGKTHV